MNYVLDVINMSENQFDKMPDSPTETQADKKRKLAERSPQDGGGAQKSIIGPWIQESVRSACDAILEQFTCTLTNKLDTVVNKLDTLIERIASVEERVTRLEAANKKLADENTELKKEMVTLREQSSRSDLNTIQRSVENCEQRANEACIEANNNEQYSRRTSLRVFGVPYNNDENIKAIITDIAKNKLGVELTAEDIEACHRLPPPRQQRQYEGNKPPPPPGIIVMFRHRDKRDNVLRNRRKLKGTPTVICEDLTRLNQQTLNRVRLSSNVHQAWSHNGNIIFTIPNDRRRFRIRPYQTIQDAISSHHGRFNDG